MNRLMLKQYLISNIMKRFAFYPEKSYIYIWECIGYDNEMFVTRSN